MKFSIISPCYNAEKHLESMIESVLQQTYQNFELIIINDGSTDDSKLILEKYSKLDSRLIVINQRNAGKPSIVRNKGIQIANGDIITFLDADDIYAPSRLQQIYIAFQQHAECALVIHDFNRVSEDGSSFSQGIIKEKWQKYNMEALFDKSDNALVTKNEVYLDFFNTYFFIWTGSIAIKLSFYNKEELLFDERLTYYEDLNKWCDLVIHQKIVYLKDILSNTGIRLVA